MLAALALFDSAATEPYVRCTKRSMNHSLTSQIVDLAADLSEPALDLIIRNGLLREIPLIGVAVKLADASRSVSDRILLAKLIRFVRGLGDVSDAERTQFSYELKRDPEHRERVGQVILLAVDHCDDIEKAEVLARILRALVRKRIDVANFRRLISAVSSAHIQDLRELLDASNPSNADRSALHQRLLPSGLARVSSSLTGFNFDSSFSSVSIRLQLSELGEQFVVAVQEGGGPRDGI